MGNVRIEYGVWVDICYCIDVNIFILSIIQKIFWCLENIY